MKIDLNQQFLYDLHQQHKLYPHQAQFAKALFAENKKLLSGRWGRKAGKSECGLYCLTRAANTKDSSMYYYFAPKAKQAREIIWASGRIQNFIHRRYIKKIKESEMRVIYWNNSFIKLDGSDEYEQFRGVEADGALYDESKDFHPLFDLGFRPNLGPRNGFLINFGTPPRNMVTPSELQFFDFEQEAKSRSDGFYSISPSWARTDPNWLTQLKQIYSEHERKYAAGDLDAINVFNSEYGAEYILGGPGSIFPMANKERHGMSRSEIFRKLSTRIHDCEFWCLADPATSSTFAVLFIILDREQAHFYVVNEIYEQDQNENVVGKIHPRILDTIQTVYPYSHIWRFIYDEAESWFKAHVLASYEDPGWQATSKARYRQSSNDIKAYLQVVKDFFTFDQITIALECTHTWNEVFSYKKDEKGNLPKAFDHCLDLLRYFAAESFLSLIEKKKEEVRTLSVPKQDRLYTTELDIDESSVPEIESILPTIDLEAL